MTMQELFTLLKAHHPEANKRVGTMPMDRFRELSAMLDD